MSESHQTESQIATPGVTQVQVVTPWKANCGTNGFEYDKLVKQFGVKKISMELLERFTTVTGHKPHVWLRRGIFFAHRDLEEILDDYENGNEIFLYTGRGPTTEALHLGHMIPFMFTKWLQDVFNATLVIQIADDEKYYFKDMDFSEIYRLGFENAKDIIACGFNPEKTFIFSSRDYNKCEEAANIIHEMYKRIKISDIKNVFGLEDSACIGQYVWCIYQMSASFPIFYPMLSNNSRCLIAYAIDQDPYFRLVRDVANKMKCHKPSSIITQFLPALEGQNKMNSTQTSTGLSSTIFMNMEPKEIRNIIKKKAQSGGRDTIKEHRQLGANLSIDMSYKYLEYFLEDDDRLAEIAHAYSTGLMTTGEIKNILADIIIEFVDQHKIKKSQVTHDVLKKFYSKEKFSSDKE